jgi:hypothetical protein
MRPIVVGIHFTTTARISTPSAPIVAGEGSRHAATRLLASRKQPHALCSACCCGFSRIAPALGFVRHFASGGRRRRRLVAQAVRCLRRRRCERRVRPSCGDRRPPLIPAALGFVRHSAGMVGAGVTWLSMLCGTCAGRRRAPVRRLHHRRRILLGFGASRVCSARRRSAFGWRRPGMGRTGSAHPCRAPDPLHQSRTARYFRGPPTSGSRHRAECRWIFPYS